MDVREKIDRLVGRGREGKSESKEEDRREKDRQRWS